MQTGEERDGREKKTLQETSENDDSPSRFLLFQFPQHE